MATIKVKVKKKRVNKKKIILALLLLIFLFLIVDYILHIPVKNIYVTGNIILSDKEIIEISNLNNYPSYINTYFTDIKKNLLKNEYIKKVNIKRKIPSKIYIEIEEYKPIAIYNKKVILSSKKLVNNDYDIDYIPYVTNDIEEVYNKFIDSFSKINNDILLKISHIEYAPNDVDKERFILYMVDSNYVHITLSKIEKLNKYNSIVNQLDNKKGIIYLDSGDYLEIKD